MRLIDASALKKKADMRGRCLRPLVTAFQMCVTVHDIDDAPTIDAVPVVRCKDCDKSEPSNVWDGWIFCRANKVHQKDDNFCSYGERKDGDGNDSA